MAFLGSSALFTEPQASTAAGPRQTASPLFLKIEPIQTTLTSFPVKERLDWGRWARGTFTSFPPLMLLLLLQKVGVLSHGIQLDKKKKKGTAVWEPLPRRGVHEPAVGAGTQSFRIAASCFSCTAERMILKRISLACTPRPTPGHVNMPRAIKRLNSNLLLSSLRKAVKGRRSFMPANLPMLLTFLAPRSAQ